MTHPLPLSDNTLSSPPNNNKTRGIQVAPMTGITTAGAGGGGGKKKNKGNKKQSKPKQPQQQTQRAKAKPAAPSGGVQPFKLPPGTSLKISIS